jgi:hypothetical protein
MRMTEFNNFSPFEYTHLQQLLWFRRFSGYWGLYFDYSTTNAGNISEATFSEFKNYILETINNGDGTYTKNLYIDGILSKTATNGAIGGGYAIFKNIGNPATAGYGMKSGGVEMFNVQVFKQKLTSDQRIQLSNGKILSDIAAAIIPMSSDENNVFDVMGNYTYEQQNADADLINQDLFHYNLKYGFTDSGSVYVPYDINGSPIATSGTDHPAGNYHNGAETKITLERYGTKSYDELKELAISADDFELYEDPKGNLSEMKVITETEIETEVYTEDNNNLQILNISSSYSSPFDQNIKMIIQGGDNEATESYSPELTIKKVIFQGNQIKYPVVSKKYGNKHIGTFI